MTIIEMIKKKLTIMIDNIINNNDDGDAEHDENIYKLEDNNQ